MGKSELSNVFYPQGWHTPEILYRLTGYLYNWSALGAGVLVC